MGEKGNGEVLNCTASVLTNFVSSPHAGHAEDGAEGYAYNPVWNEDIAVNLDGFLPNIHIASVRRTSYVVGSPAGLLSARLDACYSTYAISFGAVSQLCATITRQPYPLLLGFLADVAPTSKHRGSGENDAQDSLDMLWMYGAQLHCVLFMNSESIGEVSFPVKNLLVRGSTVLTGCVGLSRSSESAEPQNALH